MQVIEAKVKLSSGVAGERVWGSEGEAQRILFKASLHGSGKKLINKVIPLCYSYLFNYIDFSQHSNKLTTIIFIVYSYMFRLT